MQDNGLTQLFPIDFLASWVAQDPHEQDRMSGLEPYASDSRGRFSVLKSHVISAYYKGIVAQSLLCVFACHFLSSLVHTNSAKWVCLFNLLRKSSNFKMAMHFQMVYLQSSHPCVIYRQISTIVMFVNSKCPWKHGNMALTMARWRSQRPSHGSQMNPSTTSTILI